MVTPRTHRQLADRELAHRAGQGDHAACRELASLYLPRVRDTVHYLVADHRDADDLVQICVVEVLRVIGSYRGRGALDRWVDRVVARYALRQIKRRRWRESIVVLEVDELGEAPPTQESEVASARIKQRLVALLQRLSPERRTVAVLHWVRGYTVLEITGMTGIKVNTVRGHLRKAKRKLRELLPEDPVLWEWATSHGGVDG